jgi:hypothetical protein
MQNAGSRRLFDWLMLGTSFATITTIVFAF